MVVVVGEVPMYYSSGNAVLVDMKIVGFPTSTEYISHNLIDTFLLTRVSIVLATYGVDGC